ncbi:hypothetical protein B0H12DRAFT_549099 [Mycena haematopus]|nr:hypothetical protein B0H12DRAFT_549099 [Mycena haematopus]
MEQAMYVVKHCNVLRQVAFILALVIRSLCGLARDSIRWPRSLRSGLQYSLLPSHLFTSMFANGAAAAAKDAPPTAASAPVDPYLLLVYHTAIVLLALIALVVSVVIPRAFARLCRRSEWERSHFLGYEPYTGSPEFPYAVAPTTSDVSKGSGLVTRLARIRGQLCGPGRVSAHVQSRPSFLWLVVTVLRPGVVPGVSPTQMLVCAGWLRVARTLTAAECFATS